jgi:hypothetical protein
MALGFNSGFVSTKKVTVEKRKKIAASTITSEFGGKLDFSSVGKLVLEKDGDIDAIPAIDVFINGLLLEANNDYKITSNTSLVFEDSVRITRDDKITIIIKDAE